MTESSKKVNTNSEELTEEEKTTLSLLTDPDEVGLQLDTDEYYQSHLLAHIIRKPELIDKAEPEAFADDLYKLICKTAKQLYAKYKTLPDKMTLVAAARKDKWCKHPKEGKERIVRLMAEIGGLFQRDLQFDTFAQDEIANFNKKKQFQNVFADALADVKAGKPINVVIPTFSKNLRKIETADLPTIEDTFDFSARDLMKPQELIQGLLHKGSKMGLGGASKSYKSWLLSYMGLCVAYGRKWLGCDCSPTRVLLVNLEIQEPFMQSRLNRLYEAEGIKREKSRMDVWNLRGYAASYKELFPKIEDQVAGRNYGLIIFDPIYKLYGPDMDENSASDVAALLNAIEHLTQTTGAAVAYGSHFAKGNAASKNAIDRVSGSGVFARDPDSLINLTAHQEPDCFVVDSILRNFPQKSPFVIRWDFPLFRIGLELDPMKLRSVGRPKTYTKEVFLMALGDKTKTNKEWEAEAFCRSGCSHGTFNTFRDLLVAEKLVAKTDSGQYIVNNTDGPNKK